MPRLIPIGFLALIALQATAAAAAPIAWTFAGTTNGAGITQIPVGSPFTVSVYLDSAAPNLCPAGYPSGHYQGTGGVLTVQSAVAGTHVYTSSSSNLFSGTLEAVGCSLNPPPPGPTAFELRMGTWSGPSFADAVFDPFNLPNRPGLFWFSGPPTNGAFPINQPIAPYFDGPRYLTDSGTRSITSFTFVVPVVPEVGSSVLVGIGLVAAAMRLANRRALVTRPHPQTVVRPSRQDGSS